jgi:hypothetical protein
MCVNLSMLGVDPYHRNSVAKILGRSNNNRRSDNLNGRCFASSKLWQHHNQDHW